MSCRARDHRLLVPLVGAIVVFALPRGRDLLAKQVTLLFSLAALASRSASASRSTTTAARFQFVTSYGGSGRSG